MLDDHVHKNVKRLEMHVSVTFFFYSSSVISSLKNTFGLQQYLLVLPFVACPFSKENRKHSNSTNRHHFTWKSILENFSLWGSYFNWSLDHSHPLPSHHVHNLRIIKREICQKWVKTRWEWSDYSFQTTPLLCLVVYRDYWTSENVHT